MSHLILTRKQASVLRLTGTGEVKLTVVEIDRDQVKLSFEGPHSIAIVRDEAKVRR